MKIVLIGGGGHCRACIDVVRSAGLEVAGIVDPAPVTTLFGYSRLGDDAFLSTERAQEFQYLITVGAAKLSAVRAGLFAKLCNLNLRPAIVVAATAIISHDAGIGAGTIIMHRAVVNGGAVVGANCILNTGSITEHDARVGDHVHISTGAIVNGGVKVGAGAMIGSGAVVVQNVTIGADVMVGAGAVVNRDILSAGTWAGVPARKLT